MSTLNVVGGTYIERCEVPSWSELYGSGTRAAAALCGRAASVILHTCIGKGEASLLETSAATFGFQADFTLTDYSIAFHYLHALARPEVRVRDELKSTLLTVSASYLLRFGMLEANAIVHGDTVVYDPQSPYAPQSFRHNGSTARRLAIVLNRNEANYLSGVSNVNEAGRALLRSEQAEVVIIKDGPRGATVFTNDSIDAIPAFRTRESWLLGSGDVFSAIFAYDWMIEDRHPVEAANIASLSTAFYCQTKILPIPVSLPEDTSFHLGAIFLPTEQLRRLVYLVGPRVNLMQLWCIQETERCLREQGFDVLMPYQANHYSNKWNKMPRRLATMQKCDLVFAILDGYDPATVYEIGYASALNKPVIAFSTPAVEDMTVRAVLGADNCQIFDDLPAAIYASTWSHTNRPSQ